LRRAVETARVIVEDLEKKRRDAVQAGIPPEPLEGDREEQRKDRPENQSVPELIQVQDLRERDFGAAEGESFRTVRARGALAAAGAESTEQMRLRAERFVRDHLAPALTSSDDAGGVVVVVSHGIILGSLLRVLLAQFGDPGEMQRLEASGPIAWHNTGYVELAVEHQRTSSLGKKVPTEDADDGNASGDRTFPSTASSMGTGKSQQKRPTIRLSVVAVNVRTHLEGLKKTRGGIGSALFDKRQRTMESFFGPPAKKSKTEGTGTN
jgi:probable phosphoglycerate mutase